MAGRHSLRALRAHSTYRTEGSGLGEIPLGPVTLSFNLCPYLPAAGRPAEINVSIELGWRGLGLVYPLLSPNLTAMTSIAGLRKSSPVQKVPLSCVGSATPCSDA
jgi:hypothetical protein